MERLTIKPNIKPGIYLKPCTGMVTIDGRVASSPTTKEVQAVVIVSDSGEISLKQCPHRLGNNYCGALVGAVPTDCSVYRQATGGVWMDQGKEVRAINKKDLIPLAVV